MLNHDECYLIPIICHVDGNTLYLYMPFILYSSYVEALRAAPLMLNKAWSVDHNRLIVN